MTNLHHLVPVVLLFVGQATACVEWKILNPPIIFGTTAQLSCGTLTPNASYNTHTVTSWLGGKDYSTLTYTGGTADRKKYAEIRNWHKHKFESILQIYKFDENDVNVDYSCSVGGWENRKQLPLAPDKFEYHPDKDSTTVLASVRNGYLDVIMKISKVYPIPKCTIMFNENIISRRLTTKISVNGIFYKVEEKVEHYHGACSGQLIVTCVVGKTKIPIHQESLNRCTKPKEESSENSDHSIISISAAVLLVLLIGIGLVIIAKYGKLKNALCCNVDSKKQDMRLLHNFAEMLGEIHIENQGDNTNDIGLEAILAFEKHRQLLRTTNVYNIAEHNATHSVFVDKSI